MSKFIANILGYTILWGGTCSLLSLVIGINWKYVLAGCSFVILSKTLDEAYFTFIEKRHKDYF